jgi:hypothetical protein
VKLAEKQPRGLHSFNGQDLLLELEELCACMAGVKDEQATETGELSKLVVEISNAQVDLGILPIRDIPQLPMLAQEVLSVTGLIRLHLREEHASSAGPWD